ncbi:MAG: DUF3726 domain-containing protein [Pseudomonadota bacterium]
MTVSLGEVEALAKKAARGAGLSWGLAEEAGFATRWLCARHVDGCGVLAGLLSAQDGVERLAVQPDLDRPDWAARAGAMCPLQAGACLADHAPVTGLGPTRLGPVSQPLLLAPFLAQIAQHLGRPLALSAQGGAFCTDGDGLEIERALPAQAQDVRLACRMQPLAPQPRAQRADPCPRDWETLDRFAHRTYAPATEQSRRKGAGADL